MILFLPDSVRTGAGSSERASASMQIRQMKQEHDSADWNEKSIKSVTVDCWSDVWSAVAEKLNARPLTRTFARTLFYALIQYSLNKTVKPINIFWRHLFIIHTNRVLSQWITNEHNEQIFIHIYFSI